MTTLWIKSEIYNELMFYAHSVDAEVGGLGRISIDNDNLYINELFLPEQEVHSSECTLSAKGIADLYESFIAKGETEKLENVNLWWHSHHTMPAFFSKTDVDTMREWPGKYVVALVVNRDGEMVARVMTRMPVIIVGDIDVKVSWLNDAKANELTNIIKSNVKIVASTPQSIVLSRSLASNKKDVKREFEDVVELDDLDEWEHQVEDFYYKRGLY